MTNLPTWRKGCTPHRDIQENAVSEALFAVNFSRAIAREEADRNINFRPTWGRWLLQLGQPDGFAGLPQCRSVDKRLEVWYSLHKCH